METAKHDSREVHSRRDSKWALLVFVPCSLFISYAAYDWYLGIQLEKKAITTQGVITRIELGNHGQFDYEYSVGSVTYSGGEIIAGVSLHEGQRVQVTYDPDHPQMSTLGNFGAAGTRPVPLVLIFVLGLMSYFRLRRFLLKQMGADADPYS